MSYNWDIKDDFEIYWKVRQYRHPEEKRKEKSIAWKFFRAGWYRSTYFKKATGKGGK